MQRIHFSDGPTLIEAALQAFPDSVASYLEALLPTPIQSTGMLPVTLIAAVWSSSMGMLAVIKGLDQIFQVKELSPFARAPKKRPLIFPPPGRPVYSYYTTERPCLPGRGRGKVAIRKT